ncbi:neural cell adhesion molecule 2 isoform X5 [Drosophila ananassae]|uniref:neural cell adhesion molecule 2 isoform X5 n=1 Tax=Drosophila ananassae TaxID=7217 RepID=UPI0013A5E7CE|nr:neural cell adhesion molecule 2 isoform X5 [Drosophila ananassae]
MSHPLLLPLCLLVLSTLNGPATAASRVRVSSSTTMTRNIEEENALLYLLAGPPVLSESIMGTVGRLPCNVTPPIYEDRVALVIWYKVGLKTPIYSVDTRDSNFAQGTHWSDETYRERLSFHVEGRAGTLTIKSTTEDDTGEYRCRVDFQKSPTRNSKVNLTVIIPPESVIILDSKGATIKDHTLGPYNEGSGINITCVAIGGRPQPRVTWLHGNTVYKDSSVGQSLSERRVGNVLSLPRLERKNLHMQLTCRAENNNLTTPIISSVVLDMNLRPLIVKLQGENRPLSAGNSYQLSCVVIGARPAPTITWWKGSTPMKNTHEIANPDGNMTTSVLTFTPTIDDRGKFLSCRAEQSMIPESGLEDGWKLDIYHIPVVSLELGTNSLNSTLREGIDVFFECNIKSNPWIYQVSWRHNGEILSNNPAEGIAVSNQSLVLQNASRARSGIYTCVGSNREGDGESNPVQLDIRFAPVCRPGQRTTYSAGRQETVKVACEIDANPSEATYVWKFNASHGETIDILSSQVAVDRGRSIAHYTPQTENDYGTLLCWATNEIGDQSEPCVYTIVPAGEPDPLLNCTVLNQTSTGFQIECIEGFDGGLQQDFIMEVYANGTTRYPKISKSKRPYFEVSGLVPGMGYNVFLLAHNSKGRSNATILQVYTLKDPEKQTVKITFTKSYQGLRPAYPKQPKAPTTTTSDCVCDEDEFINLGKIVGHDAGRDLDQQEDLSLAYAPVIEDIRPFLGILAGIVGSIFLVALIIVIVVRVRGSSGRDRNNYSHPGSGGGVGGTTGAGGVVGGGVGGVGVGTATANGNGSLGLLSSNNNGSLVIGTLGHNGGQSVQDMHRIGRETCHVTSSLDSIDKNPDIIPQDGHDVDDEWTTKGHGRTYATAALAEQNAVITSGTYDHLMPTYAVVDKKTGPPPGHGPYIQYNTLIPVSKMGAYANQQQQQQQPPPQKTELSYSELAAPLVGTAVGVQRMAPYCSATLGRPGRQAELKRAEPNIYSQVNVMMDDEILADLQAATVSGNSYVAGAVVDNVGGVSSFYVPSYATRIDLAHHPLPMYSTSPMFGTNSTITGVTGVTMSHPSQLATFSSTPPPPIFAHSVVTTGDGLLQPVTCMGLVATSSAAAVGSGNMSLPPQHQQQQQLTAANGGGNGSIVGMGMSLYGSDVGKPQLLKTVPEELHHQLNGEDVLIAQDRNMGTGTRF